VLLDLLEDRIFSWKKTLSTLSMMEETLIRVRYVSFWASPCVLLDRCRSGLPRPFIVCDCVVRSSQNLDKIDLKGECKGPEAVRKVLAVLRLLCGRAVLQR
jgi:hypothetical protein